MIIDRNIVEFLLYLLKNDMLGRDNAATICDKLIRDIGGERILVDDDWAPNIGSALSIIEDYKTTDVSIETLHVEIESSLKNP